MFRGHRAAEGSLRVVCTPYADALRAPLTTAAVHVKGKERREERGTLAVQWSSFKKVEGRAMPVSHRQSQRIEEGHDFPVRSVRLGDLGPGPAEMVREREAPGHARS